MVQNTLLSLRSGQARLGRLLPPGPDVWITKAAKPPKNNERSILRRAVFSGPEPGRAIHYSSSFMPFMPFVPFLAFRDPNVSVGIDS